MTIALTVVAVYMIITILYAYFLEDEDLTIAACWPLTLIILSMLWSVALIGTLYDCAKRLWR